MNTLNTTKHEDTAQPNVGSVENATNSVENAVKEEPKDPRIEELKKNIEEERKKRFGIIDELKKLRKKVGFKKAEQSAILKLLENNKEEKKIGYLLRLKEKLEFKISTEASTLEAEKELIRRINEVNEELDRAIKNKRLKRRAELLSSDIEQLNKEIEEKEKLVKESEKKLDELYDNLRALLGKKKQRPKERRNPPKQQEISLADVAIIKDKTNKNGKPNADENEEIESN
ncbi:MAG: hypothetical protein RXP92_03410 [Candidatus Micrarchaeota archaeon]